MNNIDNKMISSMTIRELTMAQEKKQEELKKIQEELEKMQEGLELKNQKVMELKKSAFDTLQKIVEITGSTDTVDELIQEFVSGKAEQPEEVTEQEKTEQTGEIQQEEQVQDICMVNEEEDETSEEALPSLASLSAIDCDTILDALKNNAPLDITPINNIEEENDDPYEYRNEEEYQTVMKRRKMLQPMSTLFSGDITSKIKTLGYNQFVGESDFKQHLRVIDAEGGGGNTLTTEVSPWLYISEKSVSDSEICQEMKTCA